MCGVCMCEYACIFNAFLFVYIKSVCTNQPILANFSNLQTKRGLSSVINYYNVFFMEI